MSPSLFNLLSLPRYFHFMNHISVPNEEPEDPTFYRVIRDLFDSGRHDDARRVYRSIEPDLDSALPRNSPCLNPNDFEDSEAYEAAYAEHMADVDTAFDRVWGPIFQKHGWVLYYAALEERADILLWFGKEQGGYDSDRTYAEGQTLLHAVASRGLLEVAQDIVWYGGKVELRDGLGRTIFDLCPGGADAEFAGRLRTWISEFNAKYVPTERDLALMKTVADGDEPAVATLLQNGASPNAYDYRVRKGWTWPRTVLMRAARSGSRDIVRRLLDAGANVNQFGGAGDFPPGRYDGYHLNVTALAIACRSGHGEIVNLLIASGADVSLTETGSITPLMCAVYCGYPAIATKLIQCGAEVNAIYDEGYTALFFALENADRQMISLLLSAGARQIGRLANDRDGMILWHWLASGNRSALRESFENYHLLQTMQPPHNYGEWWEPQVALLPKAERPGAEWRARLCQHLYRAAQLNDSEPLGWLLELGLSVEGADLLGAPLCFAAEAGSTGAAEFLVSRGAKTDPIAPEERAAWLRGSFTMGDPLVAAAQEGHDKTLAFLILVEKSRGEVFKLRLADAMRMAIFNQQKEAIRILLSSGADPNLTALCDSTPPLAHALDTGNEAIVSMLIQAGALPLPDYSRAKGIKVGMKFGEVINLLSDADDVEK